MTGPHGLERDEGTFESTVRRLVEPGTQPDASLLPFLSDPGASELDAWRRLLPGVEVERRRWIAHHLLEASEASFEVTFDRLFAELLADPDGEVRATAVDGLWEADDPRLVAPLVEMVTEDVDVRVRARAAAALGRYVQLGQLDKIEPAVARDALAAVIGAADDESEEPEVRRRATEAAGYGEYAEVGYLIEAAHAATDPSMRAGALRAMGNSADDRWEAEVVSALSHSHAELRFEAARAAGELALDAAVPALAALATDDDVQVAYEAIWALGEIGGPMARRALEALLAGTGDEAMEEAIEDALASLSLSDGDLPWSELYATDGASWPDGLDDLDLDGGEFEPYGNLDDADEDDDGDDLDDGDEYGYGDDLDDLEGGDDD